MKLNVAEITILMAVLVVGGSASNELWCYSCNADDLTGGHKADCNDPYTPAASDLTRCPQNETQLCLKSLIFYKHVHVTVRGCTPATARSTYCSFTDVYPDASLDCLFCEDNACNTSPTIATSIVQRFIIVSIIVSSFAFNFVR